MSFIEALSHATIAGLDYAVRDWGPVDGEPLLLLHGLMDTGASFAGLVRTIDKLAPGRYRFIAPDWRGHGASAHAATSYWFPQYLADLDALIAEYVPSADTVVVVGHSMGGQVASLFAGLRPARVSHLIALDSLNVPDTDPNEAPGRYRRWLDAHRQPPEQRMHDSIAAIAERLGKRYPELGLDQRLFLATQWSHTTDKGAHLRADPWHRVPSPYGFRASEAMAIWRQVSAPVLCIDGADSPARLYVDELTMQQRRDCFNDLRRRVLPACGHMLHVQRPDAVADEVHAFLRDATARPADS